MSRTNFAVEQGYDIHALNGALLTSQLSGAAAPGGDTGPQDDAPIGSIYQRTDGTLYVKTADTNNTTDWVPLASGSGVLSGGYTPQNGDPTAGDTFEEAIEKLDGNQDDIQTALGIAQGDVDFGTFTGDIISDNVTAKVAFQELETELVETRQNVDDLITLTGVAENSTDLGTFSGSIITDNNTIKGALQDLETALENIEGGTPIVASGITAVTTVDSLLVDDVHSMEWEVVAWEEATPANKKFFKITALHDGTASADATSIDDTLHTRLRVGSNFNLTVEADLNGAGGAQEMRLRIGSSTAGVAVEVRRTGVLVSS